MVTGGAGFIGSSLAIRLAREGAEVTVVDSMVAGCGGNRYNLESGGRAIRFIDADIGDARQFRDVLARQQVIFNLAGEVSHPRSMSDPERDLRLNALSHLRFLQACATECAGARVVYAGTRQVYGAPDLLPVNEAHRTRPLDFNGVHKLAAEQYHCLFHRLGQLDCTILRLSNVYGPRMGIHTEGQGFLVTYVSRLVRKLGLEIYGDGLQWRDPVYVDDVVEAFLAAGSAPPDRRRVFNVAGPRPMTLREIAETACATAGTVAPTYRPFPEKDKRIDIGSFEADTARAQKSLGWQPRVEFADGIARTLAYFEQSSRHYLRPAQSAAAEKVA